MGNGQNYFEGQLEEVGNYTRCKGNYIQGVRGGGELKKGSQAGVQQRLGMKRSVSLLEYVAGSVHFVTPFYSIIFRD